MPSTTSNYFISSTSDSKHEYDTSYSLQKPITFEVLRNIFFEFISIIAVKCFELVTTFSIWWLNVDILKYADYILQNISFDVGFNFLPNIFLPLFSLRYIKIYAKYMSISFFFLKLISDSDIRFYDTQMNGDRIKYYISQRNAKNISRTIVCTLHNN